MDEPPLLILASHCQAPLALDLCASRLVLDLHVSRKICLDPNSQWVLPIRRAEPLTSRALSHQAKHCGFCRQGLSRKTAGNKTSIAINGNSEI